MALITKRYLKAESQRFFSSSSTSPFFCDQNTFLLSTSLYPCLLHYLFCLHLLFITLLSLWCVFPLPFLSLFTALCTVTISSNNQHFKKCRKKLFALSLCACTVCFHVIWLIHASLMAQKIQSYVIFYLTPIQKDYVIKYLCMKTAQKK